MATSNSGKTAKKMPRGKPFQKGQSGNPKGRPPVPEDIRQACREISPELIDVLKGIASDPDARDSDRIRATEVLLDRGYGRPAQSVELETVNIPQVVFVGTDNIPE